LPKKQQVKIIKSAPLASTKTQKICNIAPVAAPLSDPSQPKSNDNQLEFYIKNSGKEIPVQAKTAAEKP